MTHANIPDFFQFAPEGSGESTVKKHVRVEHLSHVERILEVVLVTAFQEHLTFHQ